MIRTTSTVAAVLMTLSSAAFAQTVSAPVAASTSAGSTPENAAVIGGQVKGVTVQNQVTANLKSSGFTDVRIVPESFLVRAKDKSGNPVAIFLNPDSLTMVTTDETQGQNLQAGGDTKFATIPARDDLSSKVVGVDVYNAAHQDIGTIKDVAFTASGVKAYIVGVGGFLGVGDHYVAVRPSAIDLSYNATDKKWHAAIDATAEQLKAAPEYKYSSNS